ncbi:hypothetical protein JNW98_34755, partial [Streptomyces sp. SCA2-4]|nr:hypothetical protein [Streptomyces huiliensis]
MTAEPYDPYDPDEAPTVPLPLAVPLPAGTGRHRAAHVAPPARPAPAPPAPVARSESGRPRPERRPEKQPGEKARQAGKPPRKGRERGRGAVAKGAGAVGGGAVRPPKTKAPARTGLLGASAAVAIGAVAMVSGLLPGNPLTVGDSSGGRSGVPGGQVRADAPIEVPAGARPGRPAAGHTGPTVPVARPGAAVGTAYDQTYEHESARSLVRAVAGRTSADRPAAVADTAASAASADTTASAASAASTAASVSVPGSAAARVAVDAHRGDAVRDAPARPERADSAA